MRRVVCGVPLVGGDGHYATEDGRFEVFRDTYPTGCDERHVVRLPRAEWYEGWKADGTYGTVKGYVCEGSEDHEYTRWNVWDVDGNDYLERGNPGGHDTMRQAAQALADHLARERVA